MQPNDALRITEAYRRFKENDNKQKKAHRKEMNELILGWGKQLIKEHESNQGR